MTQNEESLELASIEQAEVLKPANTKDYIIHGSKECIRISRRIAQFINSLFVSAEQVALAQPESYAKIRARIKINTLLSYEYFVMNTLATIIVCCGLATNSILAIFGASAIAMLLDPIMGASLAIVESDKKLFIQAMISIVAGALIVILMSFIFSVFYRYHITNLPESNLMKYATPNLLDLVMAIACGAACAYAALSRKLRLGLGGIMLSITLMPPLAACGIFIAHGSLSLAAGSMVSFLANYIALQFTASLVFWLHGFRTDIEEKVHVITIFKKNKISISIILMLAIFLSLNLKNIVEHLRFEQDVKIAVRNGVSLLPGADLAALDIGQDDIITVVVRSPNIIKNQHLIPIQNNLPLKHGRRQSLRLRVVSVNEVSA